MTGTPESWPVSSEPSRSKAIVSRISLTSVFSPPPPAICRLDRQHDQRQRAVLGEELAAQDLVRADALDQLVVGGALGECLGEERPGDHARPPAACAPRRAR